MTDKRRMRRAIVASGLWLLAACAFAQGPQRSPQGRNAGGEGPHRMLPEQRGEAGSPRDQTAPAGGGRMSPEERRQLRRDVHEAGRDLYPERMQRGRREGRRP